MKKHSLTIPVEPYAWQRQLAAAFKLGRRRAALQAAPGAGKTLGAMVVAKEVEARRIVIVAPAGRVAEQWVAAAEGCGARATLVGGKGQGGEKLKVAMESALTTPITGRADHVNVAVLPWSRLQRAQDAKPLLEGWAESWIPRADLLIVDESHYAQAAEDGERGRSALGYYNKRKKQAFAGMRHFADRILALTGTPATSDARKIRAQLLFAGVDVEHPELGSRYDYERQWWGGRMKYDWAIRREVWKTEDEPKEGHDKLISAGIVKVSSEELARQLPAHRRVMLPDLGKVSARKLGELPDLEEWEDACQHGDRKPLPMLEDIADVRREQTAFRLPAFVEHVSAWHREAAPGEMLSVWCAYQDSVMAAATALADCRPDPDSTKTMGAAHTVTWLHGGMKDKTRSCALARVLAGKSRVLVATYQSAGTGLDGLQHVSSRALILEAPHTPGEAAQLEGRIFRTGQTKPVITEWVFNGVEAQIARGIGLKAAALNKTLASAEDLGAQKVVEPDTLDWRWARHKPSGSRVAYTKGGHSDEWQGATVAVADRLGTTTRHQLTKLVDHGEGWSAWLVS